MNTGKAAYGILSTNSNVTTLVGTRIFPEIAEQEAATPFIVYQLQSVDPDDTHDGPSELDEVRFEFICYADTYDQAADVGEKVRGALDRVSGTYNGVNVESIQFNDVDINIEYDPRRYSQVLTFTFRIKRDDITIALGTPVTGAQLGDLSDVNVTGVSNGQVIAYNSTSGNWEASSAAGGASSLNDLSDVTVSSPANFDILLSNGSGAYANSSVFNDIYTNIKTGASTSFTDGANSNSEMALTATTAKLKTGVTEVLLTETSPGDIEFVVATDASGSTAFTAIHLDGTTTASEANLVIKQGASLAIEGNSSALAKFRNTNSGNTLLSVPSSTGTLALTSDIASDSAVVANTAKTSFPGFGTSAGTALEGDTALLQLGTSSTTALAGDTTTISTSQANAITANTAKTSFPGFGTSAGTALEGDTALLQLGTSGTTALAGDTTTITTDQANAITANTAKNTYPSADATKLAGIETSADVTDATNVAAAGALMDSEVTNLAQVKAFDSSDYATAAQGSTADSALQDFVDDTTPQLGGELDTNFKNILFAKTSNTNHSSNGDIIKLGTGSTTQGELCYYTSSGTWVAADADAAGTAGGVLLAIALGTDPDVDGMLLRGMYTLDHDPGTIGEELYVSTTAGDITSTAPSGTGDIVRVVGYCLDSTNGQIYFNPSNDFIELA